MKHTLTPTLLALAASTCLSAAHAQSSVTIYGVADLGVRSSHGLDAAYAPSGASVNALGSGINTTSRLGYRGTEDLGGGLRAEFNFESGMNVDSGTFNSKFFDRASIVGLGGSWGKVTAGRQTTLLADALGTIDPLNSRFASFNPNVQIAALSGHKLGLEYGPAGASSGSYRLDNSLKYTLQNGGLTVRAMTGLGEQVNSSDKLSSQGASLDYSIGNYAASLAYTEFKTVNSLSLKAWLTGVRAQVGAAKLYLSWGTHDAQTTATATTTNETLAVGVQYPISASLNLIVSQYKVDRSRTGLTQDGFDRTIAFLEYSLSKRSMLYAELDNTRWRNNYQGTGNASTGTGMSLGLKHTF